MLSYSKMPGAVLVLCRCCAGAVPVLFHTRCARAMVCRGRLVSLVPHLTLHPCLCVQANHFLLPLWNLATNNLPDFLRNPMLLVMRSVSLAAVLCCTCLSRIKPAVCVLMRGVLRSGIVCNPERADADSTPEIFLVGMVVTTSWF